MIKSFGDKETLKIWQGNYSKQLPTQIQKVARRKLRMLNNSSDIIDLTVPPANRLEKLKGERSGFYSIRINDQWRIIFNWEASNCYNVEIIDYHD